jgi:hypothetical protein
LFLIEVLHCNGKFFFEYCFDWAVWILTSYEEFYSFWQPFCLVIPAFTWDETILIWLLWQTIFFLEFSSFSFAVIVEFLNFRFVLTKASRLFLEPFQRLCNRAFSAACFCFLFNTWPGWHIDKIYRGRIMLNGMFCF